MERLGRGEIPVYRAEKRYVRKNGRVIWASVSISTMRSSEGMLLYFLALIDDISQKRELEEQLHASEKHLSQLIDFLPDPTFAIDMNDRVTIWNRAMETMTGIPSGKMLGKDASLVGWHFYGRARPIVAEMVLHPKPKVEKEYDSFTRDGDVAAAIGFIPNLQKGKPGYAWIAAKPISDQDGNMTGAIEVVRDITDQKTNEQELISQKEKVEELSAAKERFIADMTHELKTPLSVIMLHLDLMRRHALEGKEEAAESYDLVWRNALRMERSIDQIMQITNLESIRTHKEKFMLDELVRKVVEDYIPLAKSKGLLLRIQGQPLGLTLDAHLLELVLSNLLSNAVKFTEAGSISISWKRKEGDAVIEVADTGIGMSPEVSKKAFDKFFKANPDAPGSGIGLALSLEMVKKMGGRITVCSKKGEGSCFSVYVPAEWDDEKDTDNRG